MRSRPNRRRKNPRKLRVPALPRMPRLSRIRIGWRIFLWPVLAGSTAAALPAVLDDVVDRPVGRLVIQSTFQRVSPLQIEAALAPALDEGFWSLDLASLRRRVEALPWVDSIELRRSWPDALVVRVKEQKAAARWGDTGVLNVRGELFAERPEHGFPELPRLSGPEGSERDVARVYLAIRDRLIAAHLALGTLSVDERGAWSLVLATGQEIRFGRRDVGERIDRFFEVAAPALANELHRIGYIDMRYTNGFAVGWRDAEAEDTAVAAGGENAAHG
ncbi:MAG TPA: cell division protein FtsQ/DivIB [Gammaproteobacteria bacterium]